MMKLRAEQWEWRLWEWRGSGSRQQDVCGPCGPKGQEPGLAATLGDGRARLSEVTERRSRGRGKWAYEREHKKTDGE